MAFGRKNEEYDWLNDPFDEKKAAREREQARMSAGSKTALGCGCVLVVALIVVMLVLAAMQFASIAAG